MMHSPVVSTFRHRLAGPLAFLMLAAFTPAAFGAQLRTALEELAVSSGFSVDGLDRVGTENAPAAAGLPAERLRQLLRDYNYMAVEASPGRLERVIVTGAKRPAGASSARTHVTTTRLGDHHQVDALLVGPNGVGKSVKLIVDTGASTIVLPNSLMAELGFQREALQDAESQTASGTVPVKLGALTSVRVGSAAAGDVAVSFIADSRLQGAMLLGMSFLQRFRVTFDDTANELILLAK